MNSFYLNKLNIFFYTLGFFSLITLHFVKTYFDDSIGLNVSISFTLFDPYSSWKSSELILFLSIEDFLLVSS